MKKAIIIGSGVAGIACALRLNHKGYKVTVLEANENFGGKIQEFNLNGFRWDMGPSLFTLPHLIDELFELYGVEPKNHFNYHRKETICNYFWNDGSSFSVNSDSCKFINDASKFFNEDPEKLGDYLINSQNKYDLTADLFIEKSLHKASTFLNKKAVKAVSNIKALDTNLSLNEVNEKYFRNPKTIQFFNRFATYNGSSPYKTPGIMSMIPHLEMNLGTYYPKNGMRSIVDSLVQFGKEKGIEFIAQKKVKEIELNDKNVKGVRTADEFYDADLVISNSDVYPTYKNLLPNLEMPKSVKTEEKSSSGIIFYWGIKKNFPQLDLHNIFFAENYREEFEQIFGNKGFNIDPTIYLNISSKEEKQDAPDGCENWFVMINTPNNLGQNWEETRMKLRETVINKLNKILGCKLEDLIVAEDYLDPVRIEQRTSSHLGALYGAASNSKFAAFLRHPNFKSNIKGLYFCGGSVHPGGGIPLCLSSAKIVANLVPTA